MILNKYIQIFNYNKWFLSYVIRDNNDDICVLYCDKKPFNDSFKDSVYSNRRIWKIFIGHKYFMYLLSNEKFIYLPQEIREIIWDYLNVLSYKLTNLGTINGTI